MSNTPRIAIRRWNLPFLVVTVVAAAGAGGRGYAVEATTPAGTLIAAVAVSEQHIALRLARGAGRAPDTDFVVRLLSLATPSSSTSSFTMAAAGGVQ